MIWGTILSLLLHNKVKNWGKNLGGQYVITHNAEHKKFNCKLKSFYQVEDSV